MRAWPNRAAVGFGRAISGNSFVYFWCDGARVRACAAAIRLCSFRVVAGGRIRLCRFPSGLRGVLLQTADNGVTSGRSAGNGMLKPFKDKKPSTIPCVRGGVKGGIDGERPKSLQCGWAMAQPWRWVAAKRFRGTRTTFVSGPGRIRTCNRGSRRCGEGLIAVRPRRSPELHSNTNSFCPFPHCPCRPEALQSRRQSHPLILRFHSMRQSPVGSP